MDCSLGVMKETGRWLSWCLMCACEDLTLIHRTQVKKLAWQDLNPSTGGADRIPAACAADPGSVRDLI